MKILVLRDALTDVKKYNKETQFKKQIRYLREFGTTHPSLHFELYEKTRRYKDPKRAYSFRVSGKYRAYCNKPEKNTIRVFLVDPHKYPL